MTNLESLSNTLIGRGWFVRVTCTAKDLWVATLFRADYSDRFEGIAETALEALLRAQRHAESWAEKV